MGPRSAVSATTCHIVVGAAWCDLLPRALLWAKLCPGHSAELQHGARVWPQGLHCGDPQPVPRSGQVFRQLPLLALNMQQKGQ